jgi:hypothetical protein
MQQRRLGDLRRRIVGFNVGPFVTSRGSSTCPQEYVSLDDSDVDYVLSGLSVAMGITPLEQLRGRSTERQSLC